MQPGSDCCLVRLFLLVLFGVVFMLYLQLSFICIAHLCAILPALLAQYTSWAACGSAVGVCVVELCSCSLHDNLRSDPLVGISTPALAEGLVVVVACSKARLPGASRAFDLQIPHW
jgi:hypothetical protein